MKHLKLLTSESDYNEYRHSDSFSRPNVTLCKDNQSLIYKDSTFDMTVDYIYLNGQTAAPTFVGHYLYNENYNIVSPTINGFNPSQQIIQGIMPNNDLSFTIQYTASTMPIDDPIDEPVL